MSGAAPGEGRRYLVALDGGNSKTDVVLVADDGQVLLRVKGGPFVPHLVGADAAVAAVAPEIVAACAASPSGRVDLLAGYLANADLVIEEERIHAAISGSGWARDVVVANDTLAMLRTGSRASHGVAVVCGAGINCVGIAPDGRTVRFAALGRVTGDWGGGFMIAKEVLWATSRAEDGRGPATGLSAAVAEHFGASSALAVSERLHLGELDAEEVLDLVPLLFAQARLGDAVARGLVLRQGEEIALLATTALRRLDMTSTPTDLVLGGGMITAREPLLLDRVTEIVAREAPLARPTVVEDAPILGAALLGLERLWAQREPAGGRASAQERLRTGLRSASREERVGA